MSVTLAAENSVMSPIARLIQADVGSLSELSLNNEAIRTQGVMLRKKINLTTLTVRILFSFLFFAFVSSFHILFSDRTAFWVKTMNMYVFLHQPAICRLSSEQLGDG